MKKIVRVGSLFAGVGGFCLGMQLAEHPDLQYQIEWANEIDEYACETYRCNFSHQLLQGDINHIINPDNSDNPEYYQNLQKFILSHPVDVLNGGFPCQPFSIAGEQKGFNDDRGNLFLSIVKLIELMDEKGHKPRVLFLENVKNLKTHDNGRTYSVIKNKLEEKGYIIKEAIINTMDYSYLPQNRERIYILGFLNKEDASKFAFFENLKKYKIAKSKADRVGESKKILDMSISDEKYFYIKEKYPYYFTTEEEFKNLHSDKRHRINLKESVNEMYQFYQMRRGMYVRKNKSNVCPTLTANMGTGGHNVPIILTNDKKIRKLTPKETFLLQGFPIDNGYSLPNTYKGKPLGDCHLYKQAGNAVSVPIIKLISEHLFDTFQ